MDTLKVAQADQNAVSCWLVIVTWLSSASYTYEYLDLNIYNTVHVVSHLPSLVMDLYCIMVNWVKVIALSDLLTHWCRPTDLDMAQIIYAWFIVISHLIILGIQVITPSWRYDTVWVKKGNIVQLHHKTYSTLYVNYSAYYTCTMQS